MPIMSVSNAGKLFKIFCILIKYKVKAEIKKLPLEVNLPGSRTLTSFPS